eukprot:CAMPEP_0202868928 /NCGR_PEP_ID=MMETSP1391-20130828/11405_1 /ASSEMBLY_ACC=CAM_ASM_000867 /TAXON_ID=1034604 /ORGANISM="Chlamydomonas leiostraca, Strain SAG 11-49" /LENGTH=292 /DNA_ID=CAMNT_0049549159 /DNA_START=165 /DNA_END=1040 /DNA_ORIENTATION=-
MGFRVPSDSELNDKKQPLLSPGTKVLSKLTGMRASGGPLSQFGATRLCLLVTFIIMAGASYLYLDTQTLHSFLLMVQEDPYGSLHVFFVVYTLSVVLLFPCMVMQVISGALYGFWMGMVVSWAATSMGQSLAFLLGRYLFRPTVKAYLHNTWPTFPTIDAAIKREGWKLVCLLRLSPVLPYNVLNYALAITPVSCWVFSVASAVATIPWTALYVYLGTLSNNLMDLAQGKVDLGGDMHMMRTILSGAFILVTTVYGYVLSHRTINAVLKEVAEQEEELVSLVGANGGAGGST